MMKLLIYDLILFLGLFFYSCSSSKVVKKEIKSNTKLESSDLFYENNLAIIYFDRNLTLNIFKKELKSQNQTNCDRQRIVKCIERMEKMDTLIFESSNIKNDSDFFEEKFQKRVLEFLLLKSEFSILNKSTQVYEKYLIYNKRKQNGTCCFVDFEFPDKNKFISTRVASDVVVIEECDE